jgi:hypothetical protein
MPARSKAVANAKARAKGKAARQAAVATAVKPRAKKQPTAEEQAAAGQQARSEAISSAMLELADVRKAARAKRNGTPAKWLIFGEWLKALTANKPFDLAECAKRYPEIKPTTIKAWRGSWRRGGIPSNGKGKEKIIQAAIKKGATA